MRRKLCVATVVCLLLATLPAAAQSPRVARSRVPDGRIIDSGERVPNLGKLKLELKSYHDCTCPCGCYARDLDRQDQIAIDYLDRRAAHAGRGQKLALVLDIDETSLSNYREMLAEDFGYIAKDEEAWEQSAQAPAIPGTLRLYREAERLGVAVFFITGRKEAERAATEKNLRAAGYSTWQTLTMRALAQNGAPTIAYKSAARRAITDAGYHIVLNVGDQFSDLKGSPAADLSVKLPNPFYYIP